MSLEQGRAFQSFLGLLAECGYGFAYRILDAQYFGVPHRRPRVFVVGYRGGNWRRAAAVLFERESLSGDPPPRRTLGESTTGSITSAVSSKRAKGAGGPAGDEAYNLIANPPNCRPRHNLGTEIFTISGRAEYKNGFGTLRAQGGDLGGGSEMLVAHSLRADGFDANEDGTEQFPPIIPILARGAEAITTSAVRRLTPQEAERLQGFPDRYTLIPYRGKPAADGPRYQALGNSFCVPVIAWIGKRIQLAEANWAR